MPFLPYQHSVQLAKYSVSYSSVSWNIVSVGHFTNPLSDAKSCQCFQVLISSDLFTNPVLSHVIQWICWNEYDSGVFKCIPANLYTQILLKDEDLCNCLHMHNLFYVTIWCFIGSSNWECTIFPSLSSVFAQPQTQCVTVEAQVLPVWTTEVYSECEYATIHRGL